ncbi:unnamed protein product [Mytilus coruscus]|uniref:Uncharacterized protein n=1 Tax=Mytilus coruscus TaxID=42192 RepID=A0A6J8EH59_MYTCO|nr:unnamed protein product [Mytilus coruscus]
MPTVDEDVNLGEREHDIKGLQRMKMLNLDEERTRHKWPTEDEDVMREHDMKGLQRMKMLDLVRKEDCKKGLQEMKLLDSDEERTQHKMPTEDEDVRELRLTKDEDVRPSEGTTRHKKRPTKDEDVKDLSEERTRQKSLQRMKMLDLGEGEITT